MRAPGFILLGLLAAATLSSSPGASQPSTIVFGTRDVQLPVVLGEGQTIPIEAFVALDAAETLLIAFDADAPPTLLLVAPPPVRLDQKDGPREAAVTFLLTAPAGSAGSHEATLLAGPAGVPPRSSMPLAVEVEAAPGAGPWLVAGGGLAAAALTSWRWSLRRG